MKNVQIPYELFVNLVLYHLKGEDDFDEDIRHGLEQKLDAMLNRQLYSQYKTATTARKTGISRYQRYPTIPQWRVAPSWQQWRSRAYAAWGTTSPRFSAKPALAR